MEISSDNFRNWYFGQLKDDAMASAIEEQLKDPESFCSTLMWLTRGDLSKFPEASSESYTKQRKSWASPNVNVQRHGRTNRSDSTSKTDRSKPNDANPVRKHLSSTTAHRLFNVAFGLAIVCSLAGSVPMNAKPVYFTGLTFAGLCTVYAFLTHAGRIWCFLPLLMNLAAITAWPTVIGLFSTYPGYTFDIGRRYFDGEGNSIPETVIVHPVVWHGGVTNIKVEFYAGDYYSSRLTDGYDLIYLHTIARYPNFQKITLIFDGEKNSQNIRISDGKRVGGGTSPITLRPVFQFKDLLNINRTTTHISIKLLNGKNDSVYNIRLGEEEFIYWYGHKYFKYGQCVLKARTGLNKITISGKNLNFSGNIFANPVGSIPNEFYFDINTKKLTYRYDNFLKSKN